MKNLITLSFCLTCCVMSAQLTQPESRVILFSGEIVVGSLLKYESPILKQAYFTLDNEFFESNEVSFFQNSHGYFANLSKLHGENTERYAMRIRNGNIKVYEEVDIEVYGGESLMTEEDNSLQDPMLATGEVFEYYSLGDQPVREATYKNLKVDLKDNEASMNHLKKHRNFRFLQWGLMGLGSGIIAYDVVRQSTSAVRFNPFMAFGIVVGGSSYFVQAPKQDELWLAADAYNEAGQTIVSGQ